LQEGFENKSKNISLLARNVRFLVDKSHLLQKEYAEAVGSNEKNFSGYLNGRAEFPIDVFMQISEREGISPTVLYYADISITGTVDEKEDTNVVKEPVELVTYQAQNKSVEQLSETVQRLSGMLADCIEEKERLRMRVV